MGLWDIKMRRFYGNKGEEKMAGAHLGDGFAFPHELCKGSLGLSTAAWAAPNCAHPHADQDADEYAGTNQYSCSYSDAGAAYARAAYPHS